MNILFITDLYPLDENDLNTTLALKNFVDDFREKGHTVQVIRPNFILNSFIRGKKFYKTGFYEGTYNANYITPFLFDVKSKLCKINPYDIVVSHMPSGNIFANNFDGKHVCGIHNSDIAVLTSPVYSVYFKNQLLKSFRNAEKLFCRSNSIEKKLLNLYPEFKGKTYLIPSGIEESLIVKRVPKFGKTTQVLTCANLIKRKNIDKLIKAAESIEDVELTVIGDGKELNNLKKLSDKVNFTGNLPREAVLSLMQISDIFILPSVNETFGLVYLEAMASGCITVGVVDEGIDGILQEYFNGYLINPDIESIKSIILRIKNLDKKQIQKISQNCYNTVKNLTRGNCSENYLNGLLNII